jgi:hypothetical protein
MQGSIWEPGRLNQYGDEVTGWMYRVLFLEGKVLWGLCWTCGTGAGFCLNTWVFSCQCYAANAPHSFSITDVLVVLHKVCQTSLWYYMRHYG